MVRALGRSLCGALVCGVALAGGLTGAPAAGADSGCALVASPTGSDAAPGSETAPLRSAQKLADSLEPGQTGCLRAGAYDAVRFSHGAVTLRNFADERATVVGRVYVPEGSDGVTMQGLHLDGTNPNRLPSPTINARGTTFVDNDITTNNTEVCFSLGHDDWGRAIDTTIARNRIHDCGQLPATNLDHGIYVNAATDTTITGNWIYDNADRGIQLYPDAQRTTITHNVIDSNGQGIIFSGSQGTASSDTTVRANLITNSRVRNNVESWYPGGGPTGQRNTVRRNCIDGDTRDQGTGSIGTQTGFNALDNLRQEPTYANPSTNDYRLHPASPCAELLPNSTTTPGPDGATAAPPLTRRRNVVLRVKHRVARRGRRMTMVGRVSRARVPAGRNVDIMARTTGRWHRIVRSKLRPDGRFRAAPRLRIRLDARAVRVQAVVRGVGRSRAVRVRVR